MEPPGAAEIPGPYRSGDRRGEREGDARQLLGELPQPARGLLVARGPAAADDLRVPTLLAHAEWDADLPNYMLYAYFEKLQNAPYKRYVQIGEGTHTVIMEKNRMQLFQAVQQFLDEDLRAGQ